MTSLPDRASARPAVSRPVSLAKRLLATVITALAVAIAAHLFAVFMFGASNGAAAAANTVFLPGSLYFLIGIIVVGFIGAFQRWYFALAAGVVFGIAAALGGTPIYLANAGANTDLGTVLPTLLTFNLSFIVGTTLSSALLGPVVWRAILAQRFVRDARITSRVALVRVPADNLADGLVTHIEKSAIDLDLANEQWDAYVTALLDNGWSTVEVQPAPQSADSVFVEDAVVIFDGTAVITSPGAESRRGEIAGVEASVEDLGIPIARIELPGTLDGGDVLKVGSTVYVGRGGRTNAEGIRQLRAILAGTDYAVVAVPITKVLHLKSAVTALPDGTVIGYPPLVDDVAVFDRFLAVPEEAGSHVVVLAADTVLMAASAPKSQALIADLGYRVVSVDISEYEKLEGCVTCLSVRIR